MKKPVCEIWWIAINPFGTPLWPFLQLRRRDVVEWVEFDEGQAWAQLRRAGWRVAKLRVPEISRRSK